VYARVDFMEKAEKYVKIALEMGAENSRVISIDDIVFDPRSLLKCILWL
jgi:hypothetical protein